MDDGPAAFLGKGLPAYARYPCEDAEHAKEPAPFVKHNTLYGVPHTMDPIALGGYDLLRFFCCLLHGPR